MTIALPALGVPRKHKLDLSWPILVLFAALLCVLIILPMSWLIYYSLVDRTGAFTLNNFGTLVTDPVFVDPLTTPVILATSSSVICCAFGASMGWLVARTDMPLRRTVRALVTASFVTPPFLGAIAWELLAAPNSGLINQAYRALTGAAQDEHLFNIYSLGGLIFVISCYTFPYVFVLVANALDRIPGDLEDASSILGGRWWVTARRVTIPLALPAVLAGALVAFLQAMTLFGSPALLALPAGFHTMTTKIWSLFQYPPKPELAAAASLPLLLLTIVLLRAEHRILGRRGYSVLAGGDAPGVAPQPHPAQHRVRVLRALDDTARLEEYVPARRAGRDAGNPARIGDRLSHEPPGDRRLPRARIPRHGAGRDPRNRARGGTIT